MEDEQRIIGGHRNRLAQPKAGRERGAFEVGNVAQAPVWVTIEQENEIFTGLPTPGALAATDFVIGTAAGDASDRIIYDSVTGAPLYDSNSNAAGRSVQIVTLSNGLLPTIANFLII